MPRRDVHYIRDTEQLAAIVSPPRQRVIAALRERGEATVAELADDLGEKAEALYYHVHKLVDAGLVIELDPRPGLRRPQSVYRLIRPGLMVDPKCRDEGFLDTLGQLYASAVREAQRNLERALERERERSPRRDRDTGVLVLQARLAPAHVAQLRELLLQACDFMVAHDDPTQQRYSMTAIASPVVRRR